MLGEDMFRLSIALVTVAVFSLGCATRPSNAKSAYPGYSAVGGKWLKEERKKNELEAQRFASADVEKDVRVRITTADYRFKGWQETFGSEKIFLPGINEMQGKRLDRATGIGSETIRYEVICMFVTDDESYGKLCDAEREYMIRFNRVLFRELEKIGKIPLNQPPQPTRG